MTAEIGAGFDQAFGAAIQTDGKIIAAGSSDVAGDSDFALLRYNSDGSLDTTFGTNGTVTTDLVGPFDRVAAVALQPDGKIIVAGSGGLGGDFALARYSSDGSLDATFGSNGTVTTDLGSEFDSAFAVALRADGKIIAAGHSNSASGNTDFALVRYNADGSLDTTFDTDGKATTDFAGGYDEARAVALQSDGRITAAGLSGQPDTHNFALARYNADGSLDTTFDTDGKVTTDFGSTPGVDLSVTKTHSRNFTAGQPGSYTITVTNTGTAPTNGTPVFVTDSYDAPPTDVTAIRISGRGWRCNQTNLFCTRSDVLTPGNSYPPITLRVHVSRSATGTFTNTARVEGGGDNTPQTATDPTTISPR